MRGFRGCGRGPFQARRVRGAAGAVFPGRSSRDGPAGTVLLSVRAAAGTRGQHRDQRKWASHGRREDGAGAARAGRGSGRCAGCCAEGGTHFMRAGIFPVFTPPCRSAAGACPSVCAGLVGRGFAPAGLGRVRRGWPVCVHAWACLPPAWRGSPPPGMLLFRSQSRVQAFSRPPGGLGRSGAVRGRWACTGGSQEVLCPGVYPRPAARRSVLGYPGFALRAAYRRFEVLRADWDVREVCGTAGPAQGRGKVRFTGGLPCRRRRVGPFWAPARDGRCFAPGGSHRRALPSGRRSRGVRSPRRLAPAACPSLSPPFSRRFFGPYI